MAYTIPTRNGDLFDSEDEAQMLDAIKSWLDRDVKDHVLALEHTDEYPSAKINRASIILTIRFFKISFF